VTVRRIQQSLKRWADRAAAQGYLQEIPSENVLARRAARTGRADDSAMFLNPGGRRFLFATEEC